MTSLSGLKYFKGTVVTLRRGSVVRSTSPSKEEYTLSREQKVKVRNFYEGYPETCGYPGRPAEITWAGTGGYWCWTDANNVVETPQS